MRVVANKFHIKWQLKKSLINLQKMKILLGFVLLVVLPIGMEQFPAQGFHQEPGVSHFGL